MARRDGESKRHHYVSQGYMRNFAKGPKGDEHIKVLSLSDGRRFFSNLKKIAAQIDYNRVAGDDPLAYEKWLDRSVETSAIKVINMLSRKTGPITLKGRCDLGLFIALQVFRGPEARESLTDIVSDTLQKFNEYAKQTTVTRDALALLGFDPTRFNVDEINAKGSLGEDYFKTPVNIPNEDHLSLMIMTARGILTTILSSPWDIIYFEENCLFTSDSPVTKVAFDYIPNGQHGSWVQPDTITFPLSRNCALMILPPLKRGRNAEANEERRLAYQGRLDRQVKGEKDDALLINRLTQGSAHKFLLMHPDDSPIMP